MRTPSVTRTLLEEKDLFFRSIPFLELLRELPCERILLEATMEVYMNNETVTRETAKPLTILV